MFGVLRPGSPEQAPTPDESPSPHPMSMAAPPAGQYATREEMLKSVKQFAEGQGYAIVIGRSRLNRLWLKCDRGGVYSDRHGITPENRKRNRGETRLTDCPFKVLASAKKDGIWKCHTEVPDHNHGPSEDLSIHPSLRRMTDEQMQKVNEMTEAGNTPVETLDELKRLWPDIKVLRRDIYNARKKYKTEKEQAESEQGADQQQGFEDPNGKIPGPTKTGRWEWIEDGDEIRRKKRGRTSLVNSQQQSIDPALRDTNVTRSTQPPTRRHAHGLGSLPPRPFTAAQPISAQQQRAQAALRTQELQANAQLAAEDNAVAQRNQQNSANIPWGHPQSTQSTPSRIRVTAAPSQQLSIDSSMSSPATINSKGPTPSAQVMMTRIERMEKEQKDQKDMLSLILGAVQGMTGPGNN